MTRRLRGRASAARDDSGLIAVIVALFAIVMFGLAALVVDLGVARDTKRQAQTTVDAAVLAGAGELYSEAGSLQVDKAIAAVKEYAAANGTPMSDWASCVGTPPAGNQQLGSGTPCITFGGIASSGRPTSVYVVLPARDSPAFFGGIAGFGGTTISTVAEATVEQTVRDAVCGLCILGSGSHRVQNGELRALGGNIRVNGDVDLSPNGHVSTDKEIFVEGSVTVPGNFTPAANQGAGPLADPLDAIDLPAIPAGYPVKTQPCGATAANGPGIYFSISGYTPTCTLQPGLYVVATPVDASITVNATAGVTLYFVCKSGSTVVPCSPWTNPADRGMLQVSGRLTIKAPTSGPTKGMALVYDRDNASDLVPGDQALSVTGTIYGRSVTMRAGGSDCAFENSLIVVRSVDINGNGACLGTTYLASQNVPQPMGPAGLGLSK
ncbi:MAG: hypothetical protein QOJ90_1766 [Actinomycetota bacterium]|jgi:hypothetical protein|nr:hypothetical protein [Actinomycetota bacterium]